MHLKEEVSFTAMRCRGFVWVFGVYRERVVDYSSAVLRRSCCHHFGRTAAERLRPGKRYFSFHCDQHLRDNCVEGTSFGV